MSKKFLDIQATIECGFTLKGLRDMTRTYSQFANSACGSFAKNKERIHKFKEIGDSRYIYQIELDKACFQHEMAYGDFKDLP